MESVWVFLVYLLVQEERLGRHKGGDSARLTASGISFSFLRRSTLPFLLLSCRSRAHIGPSSPFAGDALDELDKMIELHFCDRLVGVVAPKSQCGWQIPGGHYGALAPRCFSTPQTPIRNIPQVYSPVYFPLVASIPRRLGGHRR